MKLLDLVLAECGLTNVAELIISGRPIPQPRARATTVGGFARMYTDTSNGIKAYREQVALAWRQTGRASLTTQVAVAIDFVFPRPSNKVWVRKPMPSQWHRGKADIDNLGKGVIDALQDVGCFKNDSQVSIYFGCQRIASGNESQHTRVLIAPIESAELSGDWIIS